MLPVWCRLKSWGRSLTSHLFTLKANSCFLRGQIFFLCLKQYHFKNSSLGISRFKCPGTSLYYLAGWRQNPSLEMSVIRTCHSKGHLKSYLLPLLGCRACDLSNQSIRLARLFNMFWMRNSQIFSPSWTLKVSEFFTYARLTALSVGALILLQSNQQMRLSRSEQPVLEGHQLSVLLLLPWLHQFCMLIWAQVVN